MNIAQVWRSKVPGFGLILCDLWPNDTVHCITESANLFYTMYVVLFLHPDVGVHINQVVFVFLNLLIYFVNEG